MRREPLRFYLGFTYHAHVAVDRGDALVRTRFQQLRGNDLLDGEDNAVLAPDADGCAAILDCLDCVFDLEVAAVGREDGVEEIVTRSDGRLKGCLAPIRGVTWCRKLTMVSIRQPSPLDCLAVFVGDGEWADGSGGALRRMTEVELQAAGAARFCEVWLPCAPATC